VIAVLGMHRSGTSCLTGLLEDAGVPLGDVQKENPHNPLGNQENLRIMHLHDAVLAANGGSWDAPPAEPALPTAADGAPPPGESLDVVFAQLKRFAQDENRGLFAALEGGKLISHERDELQFQVTNEFHARRLEERSDEFNAVCGRFFGFETRAVVRAAASSSGPSRTRPAGRPAAPSGHEEVRLRKQAALEHPAINIALEELGAEIVAIHPLGGNG